MYPACAHHKILRNSAFQAMQVHFGILQTCVTRSDSEGICTANTLAPGFSMLGQKPWARGLTTS